MHPDDTGSGVVVAIDQGTTNTKAVLVRADGTVLATGSAPVRVFHPRPGWVEQDAEEIWRSVVDALDRVLTTTAAEEIRAVALSTQRESVLAWRRSTGEPLGQLLGWQDRRTAEACAEITRTDPDAGELVRARTGLRVDPMFSAPKLSWLIEHRDPDVAIADVCVGTVDSWLIWRLTGGAVHATDAGNASRTLLFDVVDRVWSTELADVFGVPLAVLPEVRGSDAGFGSTDGVPGLPDGTPIAAVLADSHAALYGQGAGALGLVKATYGTGSSVMTAVAGFGSSDAAVPLTLAWVTGDRPTYAREGNILSSGSTLVWTAGLLGLPDVAALLALAGTVDDAAGVQLLPAFTGLGAPHWDREVRAGITGLSQASTPAHVARAAVDAVAHQVCDVVDVIAAEASVAGGTPIELLRADGGATASPLLMQTQADLLGLPVEVADVAEVSAVGAARLAWATLGAADRWSAGEPSATYRPVISADERRPRRREWRMTLDAARAQADRRS